MDPDDQADGPCSVRLHVGGVGPSVIRSDLVQIFSSLGKVSSVDFVRTKGRNFAYITFQAASPQDIKRLFSLYNGCMWKGGRLKLEKAKEFYLDKLHREWADGDRLQEQSETQNLKSDCTSLMKNVPEPESSKGFSIYFPRLRKVKKIPRKGQGKHKRSFERVDALPCSLLKLCDCSQYCMASMINQGNATREQLVTAKEEQNLIYSSTRTSVKDTNRTEKSSSKGYGKKYKKGVEQKDCLDAGKGDAECSNEVPVLEEPLLNIMGINEAQSNPVGQNKNPTEEERHEDVKQLVQATGEETQENAQETGDVSRKRVKFNLESNITFSSGELVKGEEIKDQMVHVDATSEIKELNNSTGTNWVQKASWKSLVGETGRISFSLGSMLGPNLGLLPSGSVKSTADVSSNLGQPPRDTKLINDVNSWIDGSSFVPSNHLSGSSTHQPKVLPAKSTSQMINKADGQKDSGSINHQPTVSVEYPIVQGGLKGLFDSSKLHDTQSHDLKQEQKHLSLPSLGDGDGKVCTFMKSDKSEQEWLESKRAVKEIVKRSHKDALRSMKMFHTKQKY